MQAMLAQQHQQNMAQYAWNLQQYSMAALAAAAGGQPPPPPPPPPPIGGFIGWVPQPPPPPPLGAFMGWVPQPPIPWQQATPQTIYPGAAQGEQHAWLQQGGASAAPWPPVAQPQQTAAQQQFPLPAEEPAPTLSAADRGPSRGRLMLEALHANGLLTADQHALPRHSVIVLPGWAVMDAHAVAVQQGGTERHWLQDFRMEEDVRQRSGCERLRPDVPTGEPSACCNRRISQSLAINV